MEQSDRKLSSAKNLKREGVPVCFEVFKEIKRVTTLVKHVEHKTTFE